MPWLLPMMRTKQIYHVTVDGKAVGSKAVPVEIANEADIKYLDLEASKVWDDQDNQEGLRPASVEFQLYKNGKAQGKPVTVSAATDWKAHLRIFQIKTVTASSIPTLLKK